jgi:hypothetical protein
MERHAVALTEVIILEVRVPRHWLRHAGLGRWQCTQVIAPERLCVCTTGEEVAASPLSDEVE